MNKCQLQSGMTRPAYFTAAIAMVVAVLLSPLSSVEAAVSQVPAQLPLFLNNSVPPLNMLVVGRDHKVFFPAYNDASDLDGDGSIEIRYKPSITYLGYFDSNTCYIYNTNYFTAFSSTTTKKCSGTWSGDYLNYLTTSRIDALRKVLYGGFRDVDTTSQTILERAYIPKDAHTWGKEYRSLAVDGYNLSDYTPLSNPTGSNYTLFANNTQSSDPLLRVLSNVSGIRIFGWVSREQVQGGTTATNTSFKDVTVSPTDYAVRVEVCKTGFIESNCKLYPNGKYKPTGILHDYGEGNQMYFGLMTGTYQNNIQGGAIRQAIGSFSNEIEASTGIFGTKSGTTYTKGGIIGTLDGLTLPSTTCSASGNSITNSDCQIYGNPLAEMMFETMRYFSGATTPTAGYLSGKGDSNLGLSGLTTWVSPYSNTPNPNTTPASYPSCSKPFETLFSDVNPSYDSDLPGSAYTTTNAPSVSGSMPTFSAQSLGATIWNNEFGAGSKNVNIGETPTASDTAPTSKIVSSLGNIRGLPEEPTKQGTYNAAAVAYYGNTNPITPLGNLNVQTFSIALSSTLPRIQMPVGSGTVTLQPFGKVTNGTTESITGFYIDSLYNMPGQPSDTTVNGGRAQAVFRVVFDDCGQGCDYDMDAIVLYTISVTAASTLDVRLETVYSVAGNESHMGYTISGTTQDGIYLEVTGGGNGNQHYSLDTPGTQLPGSCISGCTTTATLLPGMRSGSTVVNGATFHTRNFTGSSARSVTNLQDPLWYAAKWGGFGDSSNVPTSVPVTGQWDSISAGDPNNYFLVSNASTLKTQLANAFNQILQKNSSVAAPAVVPSLGTTKSSSTYVNSLNVAYWSGDLTKSTTTYGSTAAATVTTQNWQASQQMPAWGSRNIQMSNQAGTAMLPFTYANLATRTYASVNLQTTLTSDQVDFIKGDTSKEVSTFRRRASLIGDIVNSSPVVVDTAYYQPAVAETLDGASGAYSTFATAQLKRRAQVYVGANDGMLHAFDAATGVEKFAFIPSAVIANLSALTNKSYNSDSTLHRYYVDGTPVVSDVYISGKWRTVLIGTLGAGGGGGGGNGGAGEIFALDITNPDAITLLWEFTSQTDADLGYSLSTPVIARLHSGEWGVIVGNGYNGNNGNASLLVLNAGTGAVISKLKTSVSTNNGLSSPVVLDANSDGIADYVYAGDLLGNLWRFDLIASGSLTANASASSYKVAFGNKPLYTATVSDAANSLVQSITAPPTLVPHPTAAGTIVIFGTGRYFASADKTSTDLQTLYGIWDKQTAGEAASSTPVLTRALLQTQSITSQVTNASFGSAVNTIRLVSANGVNWASKYGWSLDLVANNTQLGERVVDPLSVISGALFVPTRTPSADVCSPGINGFEYALDPTTGGRTTFTVFNLSRTGIISVSDKYNDTIVSGFSTSAGGFAVTSGVGITDASGNVAAGGGVGTDSGGLSTVTGGNPDTVGRQSWRTIPYP
jgi:type IV pilus assembly protein PilY1